MANVKHPFDVTWDDVRGSSHKKKWMWFSLAIVMCMGLFLLKYFYNRNTEAKQPRKENITQSNSISLAPAHETRHFTVKDPLCTLLMSLDSNTVLHLGKNAHERCLGLSRVDSLE